MRNLGNRLTLHSPSRGFSMELGACITVILATRLSKFLPPKPSSCVNTNKSSRAPCLNYPVYHRCHRRCRSLFRHLALYQLAHGCLDLHGLDDYPSCCWYYFWLHLRYYYQRSSLGLQWLSNHYHSLDVHSHIPCPNGLVTLLEWPLNPNLDIGGGFRTLYIS